MTECPEGRCEYGSDDHCQTIGGCLVVRVGAARSEHPGPVPARVLAVNRDLLAQRNALYLLVDLLWGELEPGQVAALAFVQPDAVTACRQIHELVNHQEGQ